VSLVCTGTVFTSCRVAGVIPYYYFIITKECVQSDAKQQSCYKSTVQNKSQNTHDDG